MQPKHVLAKDGLKKWELNGKLHRVDGPAYVICQDGEIIVEQWWINGNRHRVDGPAYVEYNNGEIIREEWWVNGKFHREGGPATVRYVNNRVVYEEWYLDGEILAKKDFTSIEMIDRMRAYKLFTPLEVARMRASKARLDKVP